MRNNFRRMPFAMFMLISIVILPLGIGIVKAPSQPVLEVDPKISVAAPSEAFTIDITVTNVTNLYAFQVNMTFDLAVLNCTNVDEGPFLETAGATWWQEVTINNYDGWVFFGNALFPAPPDGATGSGDLATVTFNVVAEGESSLSFDSASTKLRTLDEEGVTVPIDHTTVDGAFVYPFKDVAVTAVSPSSSSVTAGEIVFLNVTVKNKGSSTETFDVTVMYDSTPIDTQTVTALGPQDSTTLSFSWDSTGVTEGDYTIKAVADPLSGETEIQDNTHSKVVITISASPPAMPTELVLGVILAAAATCIIVAFLYVRRRGSTKT